jgi:hypothetical protein
VRSCRTLSGCTAPSAAIHRDRLSVPVFHLAATRVVCAGGQSVGLSATWHDRINRLRCPTSNAARDMTNFHTFDRDTDYLPPPSIVNTPAVARGAEVINGLDLSALIRSYRDVGSRHRITLRCFWAWWVWLCHGGVLEPQSWSPRPMNSVAFRFIPANDHPTTIPSQRSVGAFCCRSRRCSCKCCWPTKSVC